MMHMELLDFVEKELGIDRIINPDLATANAMVKYLWEDLAYFSGEFANGKIKEGIL
ncbi:hypothetical protein [Anaerotalea alkaliphila]|uniref:Uncharacterized protein n=1 Tax=Anaerotalea alkaliphila TaxID=2662126 RepID=A0A7X5HUL2_9FIRM|nr:hypothetical protein [Anaerotalea alkaliphila]NDL66865.1 hypothetical protein [Anaerotalea alkaliphila]